MDISAVFINLVSCFIGLVLAYYTFQIGHLTKFPGPWKWITIGFLLQSVGRVFAMIAESLPISPVREELLDFGLSTILISLLIILVGKYGFFRAVKVLVEE